jgi:hypothetical protein
MAEGRTKEVKSKLCFNLSLNKRIIKNDEED